jgi:dipeptidyl aminopeptidase/acylaminoacyl peptidase
MPKTATLRTPISVAIVVVVIAASLANPGAQARRTAADYLSPAYPFGLVAAMTTDRVAWISYDEGKRNVYTAAGPAFKPVRLTSFMDDDGVDLTGLSLSADGRIAVFVRGHARNRDGWVANPLSNPDGTERAIWAVRTSGGAAFRLAAIETGSPVLSPDGQSALYIRDGQIYRAPVAAGPGKTASDRGEAPFIRVFGRNSNPRWSPDGSRFAFVSNRTDHSYIGVYELKTRRITWLAPAVDRDISPTWSADGTRVAFIRRPGLPFGQQRQQGAGGVGNPAGPAAGRQGGRGGLTGMQIPGLFRAEFRGGGTLSFWVADVRTGEAREFWRHDPGGQTFRNVNAIQWAGDHVIFTTQVVDDEYDRYFSVAIDGSTSEPVMLTTTDGIIEDASSVHLSPDGETLYYTTNHGDIDRRDIFAVPTAGGTPRQVTETPAIETQPVPLASGRLALLYADARVPQSVGIVAASGGTAELVYPALPDRYPLAAHVEPTNVTLEASDGVRFNNQLFLPRDLTPGERRPAMVFVHGGPQRQMLLGYHYRHVYHMFYGINQWLVDKGYIVLSVNYRRGVGYGRSFRQAPNSGGQGNAEYLDVLAAGQYLHSRPDVDPARVAIWGLSYGGVLTAQALARNSDLFAAGIDLAGVHLWGNSLDPDSTSFKSSVIGAIDGWRSPVLLQHGDDDRNVAFTQTTGLVQMLRARNVEYELIVFPDDVHDSLVHSRWIHIFDRMDAFLQKHIGR